MPVHCKRVFIYFFIFFLFGSVITVSAASDDKAAAYYTDIPGVTEEEITQIESLKQQHPDGLVYGMIYSEEAFVSLDGQVGGYASLVSQRLSSLLGLKVTPRILEWDKLTASLSDGSVDLSGELTATPERRKTYYMSSSIAERSFAVFRNANRKPLDLLSSKKTLRYGFLKDATTYERVRETSAIPFKAVFVRDYKEAAEGLRNGTLDGFIHEATTDSLLEYYPDIAYQEYYPVAFTSVSLATANPDLSPLIDVVEKYLKHGGKQELSDLYEQGKKDYLRQQLYKSLTAEEEAYLKDHIGNKRAIPVAAEFDNYPISFYNEQEHKWQGIAHDILNEVESLTDLTFEVTTGIEEPWNSILEKLDRGDVALITNLIKSKDRSGHYLWPDAPYSTDSYTLLSRMDQDDMTISQVALSKVGLLEGTAYEETFNRIFPDHKNIKVYSDSKLCFEALRAGEVDLIMMPRHLLLFITNYMERPGFKVNVPLDIPCEAYFGLNKDQKILCSIMSKAQKLVDCEEITDRWERRVFDYSKKLAEQRVPYLAGISVLLLVILALVVVLYRKRERSSHRMVMTDPLTSLYNRRFFEKQLENEWAGSIKYRIPISLLTVDLDRFKEYNDTYGHPQGDLLLQSISAVFRESLSRPVDVVARTGGDEFLILLPNTDLAGAAFVAEKICKRVAALAVETVGGEPTKATVSIGAACMSPRPDDKIANLIAASDKALYKAKDGGGNRVCTALI